MPFISSSLMHSSIMNDESYMRFALQLASQAQGQTATNPVVGCVIVKDGRIIGLGSHLQKGSAHAEVHALRMAGKDAEGSTVYVTLEPCSHYGQTPPCAKQLIEAKVKKVVVACLDPNPLVSGSGVEQLRASGIEVEVGLLEQEATRLNEKFNKYIRTGLPFVTLKTASTLDGKIATYTGDSKWISGDSSRHIAHLLRHQHQAIMVGVETVIADNPKLNTRLPVPALDPIRVIVDSKLRTPLDSFVVQDVKQGQRATWILTTEQAADERKHVYEPHGVKIIPCGDGDRVDLRQAMKRLGEQGIGSILLEGGGRLNGSMLELKLIDKMVLFIAPKIVGGENAPANMMFSGFAQMSDAIELKNIQVEQVENDICIIGYPDYEGNGGR